MERFKCFESETRVELESRLVRMRQLCEQVRAQLSEETPTGQSVGADAAQAPADSSAPLQPAQPAHPLQMDVSALREEERIALSAHVEQYRTLSLEIAANLYELLATQRALLDARCKYFAYIEDGHLLHLLIEDLNSYVHATFGEMDADQRDDTKRMTHVLASNERRMRILDESIKRLEAKVSSGSHELRLRTVRVFHTSYAQFSSFFLSN